MAQKTTITAQGRALPCYPTMGAMLRFKRRTGKEVQQIQSDDTEQLFLFLYCCVQSACAREGVDFQLDEMQFADTLTPQEMQQWAESLTAPDEPSESEKKNESGQAEAVTPQTVEALLAYAVGVMRMGFHDFCALTPGELTLAAAQFAEERTRAHQGEWERTRTLAAITVQPHVKGKVSARSLLPLPWDKETAKPNRPAAPTMTKEQSLERLKGLLARQGATPR